MLRSGPKGRTWTRDRVAPGQRFLDVVKVVGQHGLHRRGPAGRRTPRRERHPRRVVVALRLSSLTTPYPPDQVVAYRRADVAIPRTSTTMVMHLLRAGKNHVPRCRTANLAADAIRTLPRKFHGSCRHARHHCPAHDATEDTCRAPSHDEVRTSAIRECAARPMPGEADEDGRDADEQTQRAGRLIGTAKSSTRLGMISSRPREERAHHADEHTNEAAMTMRGWRANGRPRLPRHR